MVLPKIGHTCCFILGGIIFRHFFHSPVAAIDGVVILHFSLLQQDFRVHSSRAKAGCVLIMLVFS